MADTRPLFADWVYENRRTNGGRNAWHIILGHPNLWNFALAIFIKLGFMRHDHRISDLRENRMDWVVGFVVAIVGFFIYTHLTGNPDFWKLTRQHPKEAWDYFNSRPEWYVGIKPEKNTVTGPFRVVNPITNQLVTVYCDTDKIESSQAEFKRQLNLNT